MYLLDTDICSYFLRGRYELQEKFEQVGRAALHVSRITIAELLVLAYKNPGGRINQERIEELARTLVFAELDDAAWTMFCLTKAHLQRSGRPVGDFDILQASIAMVRDLTLVTNNVGHYVAMDVRVENWVVGGR
jgi:tRNA(fMet)-specific endonuclease VapC